MGVLSRRAEPSNRTYTNHIASTPLDDDFKPFAWAPAGESVGA